MKFCFIFIFVLSFQASALEALAQKATIKVTNAPVKKVFEILRQQTGYDFLYPSDALKKTKTVSLDFKNKPLKEILDEAFIDQPLRYNINKTTVLIKEKPIAVIKSTTNLAQNITITGAVVDTENRPLPGVLISVKNGTQKSVTNNQGRYAISVPNKQSILVFSFIGYAAQEIPVGEQKAINVRLVESTTQLDEAVVIGYGSVQRKDLTGSVAQVDMEDMTKAPVATFVDALAGRIAGVNVSSSDGQPGQESSVVIRGGNSLTQSNEPLYVVDGFPMEDYSSSAISPEDIESISVLKDASATAIYGSRGANGVIVIETKKGVAGKTEVFYKGSLGFQQTINTMDMMSAYDFVKYQDEIFPTLSKRYYLQDQGLTLDDYKNRKTYDWQDMLFRTAPMKIHNLSIRGGNANTKYSLTGSLYDQEGVIISSDYKRYNGRMTIDHTLSKKLKVGASIGLGYTTTSGTSVAAGETGSSTSYVMYRTWGYRPVTATDDIDLSNLLVDPETEGLNLMINPVINAQNELTENRYSDLNLRSWLSYEIIKGLELKITGGINSRTSKYSFFYNSQTTRATPRNPSNFRGVWGGVTNRSNNTWLNENTLRYKKYVNRDNVFDIVAGLSFQENRNEAYGLVADHIAAEELIMQSLSSGTPYSISSPATVSRLASIFGRVAYNYKQKYLFTATLRRDGSSRFREGAQYGYFPSAALAWKIKEESFLKNIKTISEAKIRTSYGITGNNRVGDFNYLDRLIYTESNGAYSFGNSTPTMGAVTTQIGNEDLKWETTSQADIGLDLGLFKNRISFTADVYKKITSDLLLYANIPRTTGYSNAYMNIGKVMNKGLELSLNTINVKKKNFTWQSNFNIAFNKNKIVALNDGEDNLQTTVRWEQNYTSPLYIGRVGQPAALFYGYVFDGIYQYEDFDEVSPGSYMLKSHITNNGDTNVQPGDIKYKDMNGDLTVNASDLTIIGRPIPIHVGGFSNNFRYKSFSLNVFFQWSYGGDIYNANRLIFEGNSLHRPLLNQYGTYANRWTPENPSNELYRSNGEGPIGYYSSRTIEDGSFLRLKTVSFEYRVPASLSKKLYVNNLAFNISAQNLYTWTKYSGMDPEVSTRNSALTPGFDFSAYPRAKSIVFGISAKF